MFSHMMLNKSTSPLFPPYVSVRRYLTCRTLPRNAAPWQRHGALASAAVAVALALVYSAARDGGGERSTVAPAMRGDGPMLRIWEGSGVESWYPPVAESIVRLGWGRSGAWYRPGSDEATAPHAAVPMRGSFELGEDFRGRGWIAGGG